MASARDLEIADENAMRALGANLARELRAGDVIFLHGNLGAGKTTLVRGLVEALGHTDPVRSPTFNLVQTFATEPPVMHADLYRVSGFEGIGLEDYLDTHVCLIEWPDRATGLVSPGEEWNIAIDFEGTGRLVRIEPPRERE